MLRTSPYPLFVGSFQMLIILPSAAFNISFNISFEIPFAFVFGDGPVPALPSHDPCFYAAIKPDLVNCLLESRVKIRKMCTCQNIIRTDFEFIPFGFFPGVRFVFRRRRFVFLIFRKRDEDRRPDLGGRCAHSQLHAPSAGRFRIRPFRDFRGGFGADGEGHRERKHKHRDYEHRLRASCNVEALGHNTVRLRVRRLV